MARTFWRPEAEAALAQVEGRSSWDTRPLDSSCDFTPNFASVHLTHQHSLGAYAVCKVTRRQAGLGLGRMHFFMRQPGRIGQRLCNIFLFQIGIIA